MASALIENLAHGAHIRVRGDDCLVTDIQRNALPGSPAIVRVVGTTELVRGTEAAFMTDFDTIELVQPQTTQLVQDTSLMFLHRRRHVEAIACRTPVGRPRRGVRSGAALVPADNQGPASRQGPPRGLARLADHVHLQRGRLANKGATFSSDAPALPRYPQGVQCSSL